MQARPSTFFAFVSLLLAFAFVSPAFADVNACLEKYEQGQRLRKQSKLIEARQMLQQCMADDCPAPLRKDCLTWVDELTGEVPSIAVKAQGADGCDRSQATFTIDANPTKQRANGLLVEIDPGPHVVKADIDGKIVEQSIVVATRERGRIVTLTADPSVTSCRTGSGQAATKPLPADPPKGKEEGSRPLSPVSLVLAGTGIAFLGVGTIFTVRGFGQKSDLDDCRGSCQQEDVDKMNRSFFIGDIALGIGVAALVGAAILHFTR